MAIIGACPIGLQATLRGMGQGFDGIPYVALPTLIELKLASGTINPGRLRDLVDVQELIRVLDLPQEFAARLNPYVQNKFNELWTSVSDPNHDREGVAGKNVDTRNSLNPGADLLR